MSTHLQQLVCLQARLDQLNAIEAERDVMREMLAECAAWMEKQRGSCDRHDEACGMMGSYGTSLKTLDSLLARVREVQNG